ncbi:leucine-rich repeat extensin-like protein 3 [Cucurbita maxima]|uniref:Leucine-rich repeat extensin-like protein 3 n=1 Tax=Cucurbita maxima TaxID=3661 RepID=A0A6J1JNW0_CUCMA|nr:leucine-rich repeat extensin-like protein 3 [Cucurbita maxima]
MLPFNSLLFLTLLLLISPSSSSAAVRRLDDTPVSATPADPTVKCSPCEQNPPSPPPPPVYPSPPPPSPPPPDVVVYYSPPPPKKDHKNNDCPPPPSPNFMYITGPPGDLYPIDQNYNAAARRLVSAAASAVIGLAVAGVLMI